MGSLHQQWGISFIILESYLDAVGRVDVGWARRKTVRPVRRLAQYF